MRWNGPRSCASPPARTRRIFSSYDFTDSEDFHMVARAGLGGDRFARSMRRTPSAEVRVGSYDFDNTGHIFSGRYSGSRYDGNWPLDDNYGALREGFWLLTDRTFKAAVESMGRKRASLKNAAAQTGEQIGRFFPRRRGREPAQGGAQEDRRSGADAALRQAVRGFQRVPGGAFLQRGVSGDRRRHLPAEFRGYRHPLRRPRGSGWSLAPKARPRTA